MKSLIWLACLAGGGVGLYVLLTHLPQSWRVWLDGRKTKLIAWASIAAPQFLDWASSVQAFGIEDYIPDGWWWAKPAFQMLGIAVLVCRIMTDREKTV